MEDTVYYKDERQLNIRKIKELGFRVCLSITESLSTFCYNTQGLIKAK